MASKTDLVRIGVEGFALIDEYIVKKGQPAERQRQAVPRVPSQACHYQYQPQQTHYYQVKSVSVAEEMIHSHHQVVQFRDGTSTVDYSKRKSRAVGY